MRPIQKILKRFLKSQYNNWTVMNDVKKGLIKIYFIISFSFSFKKFEV